MLVSLSWLRDFAPFDIDPVALAETFDDLGMVVEGITRVGEGLDDVVVARVRAIDSIEGADKIRRVVVDAGTGRDDLQIVCGAWNFEVGDLVPLAPVGAVLPGDFEITRRKMRGVESNGMLCSPIELRLGTEAGGLMVLSESDAMQPGRPLREALGLEADVVFDLAIETNRPDAMCVAGVARDAAAKLRIPFAIPEWTVVSAPIDSTLVRVDALELSPRFSATVFNGASVGPSSPLIARRLTLAGMRPISNLVDVSNYIMLELGQPTHPYDLDKLPGRGLVVRAARPGESIVTLDDVERRVGDGPTPDCMICDAADQPVGIAGIMGGASSEISPSTSVVLLEAAYFDRMAIAHTSKRLGLRSEASARFERGTDPKGLERSIARFASLTGLSASAMCVVGAVPDRRHIRVRTARVNAVLGTKVSDEQVRNYLAPIGFLAAPVEGEPGVAEVVVPSFRPDTEQEIDVIEEVARHHGYANIPRTVPSGARTGGLTPYQRERRVVREVLTGAGIDEAVNSMLIGPGDHARAGLPEGPADIVEADSPLAKEESVLRTSMLPGLLRSLAFNSARQNPDVSLFEIGHVFPPPRPGQQLPDERERLSVALAGTGVDARSAVNVWLTLSEALRLDGIELRAAGDAPGLHPTRTAALVVGPSGLVLGHVGEVDPAVVESHGVSGRVAWLDIDLEMLLADAPRRSDEMRPVSRFPASDIDLAFEVPGTVPAAAVRHTLAGAAGDLAEWVRLFDVYRGPPLAADARSLAFRLRFRAPDRTLTDVDVAAVRRRCVDAVEATHGAALRA